MARSVASLCALLALATSIAYAHPEEDHEPLSPRELLKRENQASKRHLAARSCAPVINQFHGARRAKRSLSDHDQIFLGDLDSDIENVIQPYTCVTAPEIMEGPYYVNNELVRQDLTEDQAGVRLQINIGIIDTTTCEPIPNAFVEIWSANATGVYGAFEGGPMGGGPGGSGGPGRGRHSPKHGDDDDHIPHKPSDKGDQHHGHKHYKPAGRKPGKFGGRKGLQHEKEIEEHRHHMHHEGPPPPFSGHEEHAPPHGPPHRGPGRGPPGGGPSMTTSSTWLRGGYATDDDGVVELTTIFPGFYSGRTTHIHLMVRTGWEQAENGTLVSHAGMLHHVGQMFFEENWNDRVLATEPYTNNNGRRTKNEQDSLFRQAMVDKNSALVQIELLEDDVSGGLVGFVTIGIDTSAEQSIHSGNYNNVTTGTNA